MITICDKLYEGNKSVWNKRKGEGFKIGWSTNAFPKRCHRSQNLMDKNDSELQKWWGNIPGKENSKCKDQGV